MNAIVWVALGGAVSSVLSAAAAVRKAGRLQKDAITETPSHHASSAVSPGPAGGRPESGAADLGDWYDQLLTTVVDRRRTPMDRPEPADYDTVVKRLGNGGPG